jgi:glycosyltransferase involved in cell wall biosynthesis
MDLISIITINLNNGYGLQRTIESIICQSYIKYEYIIIDGASSDGSIDIIKSYATHITYWISEPDIGIYQAMNKGIARATGEYCLFVNSGDMLCNEHVLAEIGNQTLKADILTANALVEDKDKNIQMVKAPENISFYTFFNHTILHQATLIRTELFGKVGFYNENSRITGDWEFFVKALFLHHCTYQPINVTISVFDNTGLSSQSEYASIILREREEVFRQYFPYFIEDYKLLRPHSTFVFLKNIQKMMILRSVFTFTSRTINKFIKLISK